MKEQKIGDRIRRFRVARSLTQQELALKANLSRVSVGNYERGKRIPDSNTIRKIAMALDISPNKLTGNSEVQDDFQLFLFESMEKMGLDAQALQQQINIPEEEIINVLLGTQPSLTFLEAFSNFLAVLFPSEAEREDYKNFLFEKFKKQSGYFVEENYSQLSNFTSKKMQNTKKISKEKLSNAVYQYVQQDPIPIFLDDNHKGHYIFVHEGGMYDEKVQNELKNIIEAFFRATYSKSNN